MATPYHKGILGQAASKKESSLKKSASISKSVDAIVVLRIWHPDDIQKAVEESDLVNHPMFLPAFKCIKATSRTTAKAVCETVSKKLLVSDPLAFRLFAIDTKEYTMRLLDDEEFPMVEHQNAPEGLLKFAFLYKPQLKTKVSKATKAMIELQYQPDPGELTHRRLLNDSTFSKFADVTLSVAGREFFTLQAIVKVRLPKLFECDLVKKKKEKKAVFGCSLSVELDAERISYETVVLLFDWVYTGKLHFAEISDEALMLLARVCPSVGADALALMCDVQLKSTLGPKNIHNFLKVSDALGMSELKKFGIDYSVKNWSSVMQDKEGINILGIDLFQEITLAVSAGNEVAEYVAPELPPNTIADDFQRIYDEMDSHDAVVVVKDHQIPFHRAILATCSDKLSARIFQMKDPTSKKLATLDFPGMTVDAVRGVIQMLYCGRSSMSHFAACSAIEHFVEPYHLPVVRNECERIISAGITNLNVLEVLRITYLPINEGRVNLTNVLRRRCQSYICEHFRAIKIGRLRAWDPLITFDLMQFLHGRFELHEIAGLPPTDACPEDVFPGASVSSAPVTMEVADTGRKELRFQDQQ